MTAATGPEPWTHRRAVVNGVGLHYVEAGTGPLVVLLHGFPEFWYSWRHQIPALAAAGFHVLAPDLRGYNESDKPRGVHRYRRDPLKEALDRPGALTAALNYYRAAFRAPGALRRGIRRIAAPTLLIWGQRDRYLSPRLTEGLGPWVPDLRIERLADASHWVQNDAPGPVNRLLLDFLRSVG